LNELVMLGLRLLSHGKKWIANMSFGWLCT